MRHNGGSHEHLPSRLRSRDRRGLTLVTEPGGLVQQAVPAPGISMQ